MLMNSEYTAWYCFKGVLLTSNCLECYKELTTSLNMDTSVLHPLRVTDGTRAWGLCTHVFYRVQMTNMSPGSSRIKIKMAWSVLSHAHLIHKHTQKLKWKMSGVPVGLRQEKSAKGQCNVFFTFLPKNANVMIC